MTLIILLATDILIPFKMGSLIGEFSLILFKEYGGPLLFDHQYSRLCVFPRDTGLGTETDYYWYDKNNEAEMKDYDELIKKEHFINVGGDRFFTTPDIKISGLFEKTKRVHVHNFDFLVNRFFLRLRQDIYPYPLDPNADYDRDMCLFATMQAIRNHQMSTLTRQTLYTNTTMDMPYGKQLPKLFTRDVDVEKWKKDLESEEVRNLQKEEDEKEEEKSRKSKKKKPARPKKGKKKKADPNKKFTAKEQKQIDEKVQAGIWRKLNLAGLKIWCNVFLLRTVQIGELVESKLIKVQDHDELAEWFDNVWNGKLRGVMEQEDYAPTDSGEDDDQFDEDWPLIQLKPQEKPSEAFDRHLCELTGVAVKLEEDNMVNPLIMSRKLIWSLLLINKIQP